MRKRQSNQPATRFARGWLVKIIISTGNSSYVAVVLVEVEVQNEVYETVSELEGSP